MIRDRLAVLFPWMRVRKPRLCEVCLTAIRTYDDIPMRPKSAARDY